MSFSNTSFSTDAFSQGAFSFGAQVSAEEPQPRGTAPFWGELRRFEDVGLNRFLKRKVRKVIEEVAIAQVNDLQLDETQQLQHLVGELEAKNIEFEASYLEALTYYKEVLIENEIRTILRKKDEEEAMLLILIAAHLT